MKILAIDPGIRGVGAAAFSEGVLVRTAYIESPVTQGAHYAACVGAALAVVRYFGPAYDGCSVRFDEVICEWPQVYTPGKQKGDPNDLPPLVGVGAAICMAYHPARAVTYLPAQWKGQTPKDVTRERVEARLSPEERAAIWLPTAKGLIHNLYDAIGIGLHHTGRFERNRVFAR